MFAKEKFVNGEKSISSFQIRVFRRKFSMHRFFFEFVTFLHVDEKEETDEERSIR
jgi:hypothetical protein